MLRQLFLSLKCSTWSAWMVAGSVGTGDYRAVTINLFSESQTKGSLTALKKKLNSAGILILDEFGYVPYDRTGSQLLFDYLSEIHEQKPVILNTNLEFSQWVNVLYDQRMTTALIGRLTHHVQLILFPGGNNRLRESSINETWNKANAREVGNHGEK